VSVERLTKFIFGFIVSVFWSEQAAAAWVRCVL